MPAQELEIVVTHGAEEPRRLSFAKSSLVLGRHPENDIVLDGDGVSRRHALLIHDGERWLVEDQSRNGTFIDGVRIHGRVTWEADARIQIGSFQIEVLQIVELDEGWEEDEPLDEPTEHFVDTSGSQLVLDEEPLSLDLLPVDDGAVSEPALGTSLLDPSPGPDLVIPVDPPPTPQGIDRARRSSHRPPTERPPLRGSPRSTLDEAYRELAESNGALEWGTLPHLTLDDLARIEAEATRALAGFEGDTRRWSTWLAHELCGDDPLAALLRDPDVSEVFVCGTTSIELARGQTREQSPLRFSCEEALHAAYARVTGRSLSRDTEWTHTDGSITCHSVPRRVAPGGPLVLCRRHTHLDQAALAELPEPAHRYLQRAQSSGASVLLVGGPLADLSRTLSALAGSLPLTSSMTIIQRSRSWPHDRAVVVDGHAPIEGLWRCVHQLRRDWLVIEELSQPDIASLRSFTRHHRGGVLATLRHGPLDAPHELVHGLQGLFDVVITVSDGATSALSITAISELRANGLFELFSLGGRSALSATGNPSAL